MSSASVAARDHDSSLAIRAAWLHYAGGLTQAQVAKRLGLTSLKAHRLITKANQEGLVKVFIDGDVSECVELEQRLTTVYGLEYCEVVPDFDQDDLPLQGARHRGCALSETGNRSRRKHADRRRPRSHACGQR